MGVYVVGLSTDEAKVVCVQPLKPLQLLEVAEPGRAELQYRLWHLLSLIPIAANPKLVSHARNWCIGTGIGRITV